MAIVVEIVSPPDGVAPDWVREAWVGLRVPCLEDQPVEMPAVSAVGGPATMLGQLFHALAGRAEKRTGYVVRARDVVGLLSLKDEAAALWWIDNAPHVLDERQLFMFEQACCRPVDWRI